MISVRRSIVLATLSHYATQIIGIGSTIALSRLLLPEEVGVYSVGAAVLAIVHVFRDFGVSSYLVREPQLDAAKVGTCLSVSVAIAWLCALALLLATPAIVASYRLPGLRDVLYVMIASLALIPFSSVRLALLRRDMRFDALMRIEILSALANAGVALWLALAGYSFLSLAWGGLAAMLATLVVGQLCAVSVAVGRPSLAHWRGVCSFGGMSLALNLIIRLASQAPILIIGKLVDMQATGLLSRAMGLSELLQTMARQTLAPATFAAVSRKLREGEEVAPDYRRAISYLAVVVIPVASFLILMARPVLRVMFGPNWEAAEHLVQVFCISSLFLPFTIFNGAFLVALGRIDWHLRVEAVFSPLKAAVWLLALPFDLLVAAQAYVAVHVLSLLASSLVLERLLAYGRREVLGSLLRCVPIAVAAITPAALLVVNDGVSRMGALSALLVSAALGTLCWLAALTVSGHPFADELRLLRVAAYQSARRLFGKS